LASPLFGANWIAKSSEEHTEAYSQFQAAVSTARMSTDEGIKQVSFYEFSASYPTPLIEFEIDPLLV
jgi:hypothetical protein